jgi:amino acid adenylation domain-containing protein
MSGSNSRTVLEQFIYNVERDPERPILYFGETPISMGQIEELSNKIATYLEKKLLATDQIIPIQLDKSAEAVAAIMAIWKLGKAYSYHDLEAPADKVEFVRKQLNASLVINADIIQQVGSIEPKIYRPELNPTSIACVLYTSGTTSDPKGVVLTHQNLLLEVQDVDLIYQNYQNILCIAPFSFIAGQLMLFLALYYAKPTLIPPTVTDPGALLGYIKTHNIEAGFLPPQLAGMFLQFADGLMKIVLMSSDKADNIVAYRSDLYNCYAATETTAVSTYFKVDRAYPSTPVGRTFEHYRIYLVNDEFQSITEPDVMGEILIAGNVASGYYKNPELTRERFISNPFSQDLGFERAFLTGDVGYFDQNGDLVYVQRKDFMFNVHGRRVEPTEIEEALKNIDYVKDAVVAPFDISDKTGIANDLAIYAGIVTDQSSIDEPTIKQEAAQYLKPYMIPAVFQKIDKVPLNDRGKLDRNAILPADVEHLGEEKHEQVLPQTMSELQVLGIVAELIQKPNISVTEDLTHFGLNSISAMTLSAQILEKTHKDLKITDLIQDPTIRNIAALIDQSPKVETQTYPKLDQYLLKDNQLSIYFDLLQHPESNAYNIPFTIQSDQPEVALEAVRQAINYHNYLKATVKAQEDGVYLVRHDSAEVVVENLDQPYAPIAFDLGQRLYRVALYQNTIYLDFSHLVFDGASVDIFAQTYETVLHGQVLPPAPDEFITHLIEEGENDQDYYDLQLSSVDQPSILRTDRQLQNHNSQRQFIKLPKASVGKARNYNNYFMQALLESLKLFTAYDGSDHLLISSSIQNRDNRTLNHLGMFVKTLPLALPKNFFNTADSHFTDSNQNTNPLKSDSIAENATDSSIIEDAAVGLMNHPFYSLAQMTKSKGFIPQINYTFRGALIDHGAAIQPILEYKNYPQFPVSVEIDDDLNNFYITVEYDSAWYRETTIKSWVDNFTALIKKPYLPIAPVPEYQPILKKNLIELFEEQVQKTPDIVALVCQGVRFTYVELNERANQLANYLTSLHRIHPNDKIVLLLPRDENMVIAMLAAFKTNAAYVPVAIDVPPKRLERILQDTQPVCILTSSAVNYPLLINQNDNQPTPNSQFIAAKVYNLDQLDLSSCSKDSPLRSVGVDDLAYIIYTSGTTGTPKGVMLRHWGVVNTILDQIQRYNLVNVTGRGALAYAQYVFDASVSEIFCALLSGNTLHVIDDDIRLDYVKLSQYIREQAIYLATIPPALLEHNDILALNTLVVAGESASQNVIDLYTKSAVRLVNGYGPTEVSICATTHTYLPGDLATIIGQPLANTQIYLLDENLQPVPPGAAGELYVSGLGLALGYLNNPELTSQSFIPNPFYDRIRDDSCFETMYRTGDLALRLANGNFQYLSRIDDQVKIRGFRIELSEISKVLEQFPSIQQAVVIAQDQRLLAYYVADITDALTRVTASMTSAGSSIGVISSESDSVINTGIDAKAHLDELDHQKLIEHLKKYLPDYMIPTSFQRIDRIPLTSSGKINISALPSISLVQKVYQAPRTEVEQNLQTAFQSVLGVAQVSIDDDFFYLGGDSIKAIQLVNYLTSHFNYHLKAAEIFKSKTIVELSHLVKLEDRTEIVQENGELNGEIPKLPIQSHFFELNYPNSNYFNQAFMVQLTADLDLELLKQSLLHLFNQHDILRAIYPKSIGQYQPYLENIALNILTPVTPDSTIYRLSPAYTPNHFGSSADRRESTDPFDSPAWDLHEYLDDVQAHFDLATSLYSITLIQNDPPLLHFAFHHLVIDAVSWRILVSDLNTIYQQLRQGQPVELPAKLTSYRQWAESVVDYSVYASQIELEHFDQINQKVLTYNESLQTMKRSSRAEKCTILLDREISSKLMHRNDVNAVLITALAWPLAKITNSETNYLAFESHGRAELPGTNVTNTVGWFTAEYPLSLHKTTTILGSYLNLVDQLNQVQNFGIAYGAKYGYAHLPKITFNYLGDLSSSLEQSDQFHLVNHYVGKTVGDNNLSTDLIILNGAMVDHQLEFQIETRLDAAQSQTFAQDFQKSLGETIDFVSSMSDIYVKASPLQTGFLTHSLTQGEHDDAYNITVAFDHHVAIDRAVYQKAWRLAQKKYPALRLNLELVDGQIYQKIPRQSNLDFRYLDLTQPDSSSSTPVNGSVDGVEDRIRSIIQADRQEPYDLTKDVLFRVYLLKRSEREFTTILSSHHAILDGWSNSVLLAFVNDAYRKLLSGQAVDTSEDVAYLETEQYLATHPSSQAFWDEYLSDFEVDENYQALLRPEQQSVNLLEYKLIKKSQDRSIHIGGALYEQLQDFSKQHAITMGTVLQYATHQMLKVYYHASSTSLGIVHSGRNWPIDHLDQSVGLFINTSPQIFDHQVDLSILDALTKLQNQTQKLIEHSIIPLAQIQKRSERLFSTLFVFENYPIDQQLRNDPDLTFRTTIEKLDYPITVVTSVGEDISFTIKYAQELFLETKIDQLLAFIPRVLQEIITKTQISQIEYIDTVPQLQYTEIPNQTLVDLFEQQVERSPDRSALIFNGRILTYRELNQRVNQLANFLIDHHKIQPNDKIVLVLPRSEWMIIGILATLKTNAAYIPLATDIPQKRLEHILHEVKPVCLLTSSALADNPIISSLNSKTSIIDNSENANSEINDPTLDSSKPNPHTTHRQSSIPNVYSIDQINISNYAKSSPARSVSPDDLAYIIFTSGTTGVPKGVMLRHIGAVNTTNYLHKLYNLPDEAVSLFLAAYTFDDSVKEIFTALLYGRTLLVTEEQMFKDMERFYQYLIKHQVALINATPSFLELLDISRLTNLQVIDTDGEGFTQVLLDDLVRDSLTLINTYGPTENTVTSTSYIYTSKNEFPNLIGSGIQNCQTYILDEYLHQVPLGAIGELYLAGVGLASGYLNNPDQNAQKFITNPFYVDGKDPPCYARLYRTGDLVMQLDDGVLRYLSRTDGQVKIRGFRIELQEISHVLEQFPSIQQAVVIARDEHLLAYYVTHPVESDSPLSAAGSDSSTSTSNDSSAAIDVNPAESSIVHVAKNDAAGADSGMPDYELDHQQLSEFLKKYLPDYMIPAYYKRLDKMPITKNGKLDRKALPDIMIEPEVYVAPADQFQTNLQSAFQEILNVSPVSVADDFFYLGGDSIKAIQLVNYLMTHYGYGLKVSDIFTYKNIVNLSKQVSLANRADVIHETGELVGDIPLLPIQKDFFEKDYPNPNYYNQAFTIQLPADLNQALLEKALVEVFNHHDILRASYVNQSGKYRPYLKTVPMNILTPDPNNLKHYKVYVAQTNHRQSNGDRPSMVDSASLPLSQALDELQSHFDLAKRLYSLTLIQDSPALLHLAFHHLIIDSVSWRIITTDLNTVYQQLLRGEIVQLEEKMTSYRQWVELVEDYPKYATDEELENFENLNSKLPEYNQYLTDKFTTSEPAIEPIESRIEIPSDLTQKLLRLSNVNDILITALAAPLAKVTGREMNYLTFESHGRAELTNSDITNLVGWLTAMYPVQLQVDPNSLDTFLYTKNQLDQIRNFGIAYGAKYGYADLPAIIFNYLGDLSSTNVDNSQFHLINHYNGKPVDARNLTQDWLTINGAILDGQLKFDVLSRFGPQLTKLFAEGFRESLISTIESRAADLDLYIKANPLQIGFLSHSLLQGKIDDAYNITNALDYNYAIERDAYEKAWNFAQAKYPALRLNIQVISGEIYQRIRNSSHLDFHYIDFSQEADIDQCIQELIDSDRHQPYDLEHDVLFRVYLIKRSAQRYTTVISNHHSILDGWSNPILFSFVDQAYRSILEGKSVDTTEDRAYILAQEYLALNPSPRNFWERYLEGVTINENYQAILRENKISTNLLEYKFIEKPQNKSIHIQGELFDRVSTFIEQHSLTWGTLLQYVTHLMMKVYYNTSTTALGLVHSGRHLPIDDIAQSVGLYINTSPQILQHRGNQSVLDTLQTLQNDTQALIEHSNIPLSSIQKQGERLFSTLFVFENYPFDESLKEDPGLTFRESIEKLDYPISVIASQDEGIVYQIKYASELFSDQSIDQLLQFVQNILGEVISKRMVSEIQYRSDLPATVYETIGELTLPDLFEKQVQQTPGHPAVVFENVHLTYADLDYKANQLANFLVEKHKIQPNDKIVLILPRSEWTIISILAVLKTNAAYVPIAPDIPPKRLEHILQDVQPVCILTSTMVTDLEQLLANQVKESDNESVSDQPIPNNFARNIYMLEKLDLTNYLRTAPTRKVVQDDLAYLIYTSGTTGEPKAVQLRHQGVVNFAMVLFKKHELSPVQTKNVLFLSNYTFDASIAQIFPALLSGSKLVVTKDDLYKDQVEFERYLNYNRINYMHTTPALATSLNLNHLKHLQILVLGGEPVTDAVLAKLANRKFQLFNLYGPTENTEMTCSHPYQPGDSPNLIGTPVRNVQTYVLDENLNRLPVGAIGELYISGASLARGYLNQPKLSEAKFIDNPYFQPGIDHSWFSKMYRTGDLVRELDDLGLQYISRIDDQVKLRGFRIELEEISSVIEKLPQIKHAAVIVKSNQLIAYFEASQPIKDVQIQEHLTKYVPDYMIPKYYQQLDKLPLSDHGKLDRRALPEIELDQSEYVPPQNAVERNLQNAFQEILRIEQISIQDDFFYLGGDSIKAIQLVNYITRHYNYNLKVLDIFTRKNIANLAKIVFSNEHEFKVTPYHFKSVQEQVLSFAQERLFIVDQIADQTSAYDIPIVSKIVQGANLSALKQAILDIIQRHEVLSSRIVQDPDGRVYQAKLDEPFIIEEVNSDRPKQVIAQYSNYVFDLFNSYPIKVVIVNQQYLVITIHHIAFDGWSENIFIDELAKLYQYYSGSNLISSNSNRSVAISNSSMDLDQAKLDFSIPSDYPLPALEVQYKDYAVRQRQYLQGQIFDDQLGFWITQLQDFENLNLPTDFKRPVQKSYEGGVFDFEISVDQAQKVKDLAKSLDISVYDVLLSAYYLFLRAYSNQSDITVGSVFANRHYQNVDKMIGFFVNTLALRMQVDPQLTLIEFTKTVSDLGKDAQLNQDIPFEVIVERLNVSRDTSRNPIVEHLFTYQTFGENSKVLQNVLTPIQDASHRIAKFDLEMFISDSESESLSCHLNYAKALFRPETIQRFAQTYQFILTELLEHLDLKISDLKYPLSVPAAKYSTLPSGSVADLFEAQVEKTPDNIALVYESLKLSYRDLNNRVNRLANFLCERHHIRPNDKIVLLLPRNENMLIAILATLKTNAAYIPLAPDIPPKRLKRILQDVRPVCILSSSKPNYQSLDSPVYDLDQLDLNSYPVTAPIRRVTQEDLAYLIFTSGTTGEPKGVMIKQAGLVNLATSIYGKHGLKDIQTDIVLFLTNYTFDASVAQIFPALLNGKKLVITRDDLYKDQTEFENYLNSNQITYMHTTPSLASNINLDHIPSLKVLILGGEAITESVLEKLSHRKYELINFYGPSENTEMTCSYTYQLHDQPAIIGSPISNCQVYVVDQNLNLVPSGAIGELCVSGIGLSLGYLNQPALTQEKFIDNPFYNPATDHSCYARLYRTGDLVRKMLDGNLQYLGRIDDQVKLRGFRIELGEISRDIERIHSVHQAVTAIKDQQLVAYYVGDEKLEQNYIERHLAKYLPEYMIPIHYERIAQIPVTSHGKLDVRALPDVKIDHLGYVAPKDPIQKDLQEAFQAILNVQPVSTLDDFFYLGGDSIKAIQVANYINNHFGYVLKVMDIFTYKNIYNLSKAVKLSGTQDVEKETGELAGELPLLPIQTSFYDRNFPAPNYFNQAFTIQLKSRVNHNLLEQALVYLFNHHDILRATFADQKAQYHPYLNSVPLNILTPRTGDLSGYSFSSIEGMENGRPIKHHHLPVDDLHEFLDNVQSNFDLSKNLFALTLIEGDRPRLHLAFHHMIIDAVSWRIIANDLGDIYEQLEKHHKVRLSEKQTSYRQWVEAVMDYSKYARDEELQKFELINQKLPEYNQHLESLSSDRLNTKDQKANASSSEGPILRKIIDLDTRTTQKLLHQTNLNSTLIAALAGPLSEATGRSTNYVTFESHGRAELQRTNIANTVGWFTAKYPLMLEKQNSAWATSLHVKSQTDQIRNFGIAYGAKFGYNNLPKIVFNYLGDLSFGQAEPTGFHIVNAYNGKQIDERNLTHDLMSINGAVLDNKLQFEVATLLPSKIAQSFFRSFRKSLIETINAVAKIDDLYIQANPLQMGFLSHSLLQGQIDDAYNITLAFDYNRAIDRKAYEQAWGLAQQKFPALRLNLEVIAGEIYQSIHSKSHLDFQYIDFTSKSNLTSNDSLQSSNTSSVVLTKTQIDQKIQDIILQDRKRPYNLSKDILFRVYLIKRGLDQYTVIVSHHHAILDGWSNPILLGFVNLAYQDILAGRSVEVNPDQAYISAQEYIAQNPSSLEFWSKYLDGFESNESYQALLKPDQQNVNLLEYRLIQQSSDRTIHIDGVLYQDIMNYCEKHSVTLSTVLQYVTHLLMKTYYNTTETALGVVHSGRHLPIAQIDQSVGLFINTSPQIVHHQLDQSIEAALVDLQNNTQEIIRHSLIPLSKIQSGAQRLFSTLFVFENYPIAKSAQTWSDLSLRASIEKLDYPLSISTAKGDDITYTIKYAHELFSDETIDSLLNFVQHTLSQIVTQTLVKDIQYRDDVIALEYHPIPQKTLIDLFEDQVQKTPDVLALVFGDIHFTYQELDERANQLASYLIAEHHIQPNDKIVLLLPRDEKMVIAMLAAFKTNAAYVPVAIDAPPKRLERIIQDTQPICILTSSTVNHFSSIYPGDERTSEANKVDISNLDQASNQLSLNSQFWSTKIYNLDQLDLSEYPRDSLVRLVDPDDLAYIIYTSGTTGTPKGVMLRHLGVVNAILDQIQRYNLANVSGQGALAYAQYVFDASVSEIFCALLSGNTLHVIDDDIRLDYAKLSQYIREQQIYLATIPPALLEHNDILALNTLVVAGEVTSQNVIDLYTKSPVRLINGYGPTEVSICATTHAYRPNDLATVIGRPLFNTQIYLLNESLQQVPVGAAGEIYVSGLGLALGYLNNPQLTSQSFLPNPFYDSARDNACFKTMYRTGDLALQLPNGDFRYLSRVDDQVKIRGFRIELSEISKVLEQFPSIQQAVVIARDERLLAYYVTKDSDSSANIDPQDLPDSSSIKPSNDIVSTANIATQTVEGTGTVADPELNTQVHSDELKPQELTEYLKKYLPDYMIPAAYQRIDRIPLTSSGKINIPALPPMVLTQRVYRAPKTEVEQNLQIAFQSVLGVERVSTDDDFFYLGGDSIKAIQLVNYLTSHYDYSLKVLDVFTNKTIVALAKLAQSGASYLRCLNPGNKEITPLILFPPTGGSAEAYLEFAKVLDQSIPLYALENYNLLNLDHPIVNLEELAQVYVEDLKPLLNEHSTVSLGGWSFGGVVAMEVYRKIRSSIKVEQLIMIDSFIFPEVRATEQNREKRLKDLTERPDLRLRFGHLSQAEQMQKLQEFLRESDLTDQIMDAYEPTQLDHGIMLIKSNLTDPTNRYPFNGFEKIVAKIDERRVNYEHNFLMIDPQAIQEIAVLVQEVTFNFHS